MSNETIVINQSNLFINIANRRITALPETGLIASMEALTEAAAFVGGLHNTSTHIISSATSRLLTLMVMSGSEDDQWLFNAISVIKATGQLLPVSLSMGETKFVSGSCSIKSEPPRNFNADSSEPVAYPLQGVFQIAKLVKLSNPGTLTEAQLAL
jgi:hypothetical protein